MKAHNWSVRGTTGWCQDCGTNKLLAGGKPPAFEIPGVQGMTVEEPPCGYAPKIPSPSVEMVLDELRQMLLTAAQAEAVKNGYGAQGVVEILGKPLPEVFNSMLAWTKRLMDAVASDVASRF